MVVVGDNGDVREGRRAKSSHSEDLVWNYLVDPAGGIRRSCRVCADDFTSAKDSGLE